MSNDYNYSNLNIDDFNKILGEYGMSPSEIIVMDLLNYNGTKLLIMWKKNNINQSRNDSIIVTNEYDEEILKIENVIDSSYRSEEYTSYNLAYDEWIIIKSAKGTKFRIKIISKFLKEPETGAYDSIE